MGFFTFHWDKWTVLVFGEYSGKKRSRIKMNAVYFSLIRSNSKQCEFGQTKKPIIPFLGEINC